MGSPLIKLQLNNPAQNHALDEAGENGTMPGATIARRPTGELADQTCSRKRSDGSGEIGFFEPFLCQCSGENDIRSAGGTTLRHDGSVQALAQFCRELVNLVFAIDGDGLASGIEDDLAMMALADVGLDLGKELGVNFAVEVVG
jgi:hypothetical protein